MSIVMHPTELSRLAGYTKDTPHALLLVAPAGSGKETILRELADRLLGNHPSGRLYEVKPEPDKTSVGIEEIRAIKAFVKLSSERARVILVPNANKLTVEAQNSLLKLLEEPPKNVHFLLSVARKEQLLETIVSRCTVWQLRLPQQKQITEHFSKYSSVKLQRAMAIAGARIGLISALLEETDTEHELLVAITQAKEILQQPKFDRLCQVELIAKDSVSLQSLLEALELTAHAGLGLAAKNNNLVAISEWRRKLQAIATAQNYNLHNVQPKLLLSNLFITL